MSVKLVFGHGPSIQVPAKEIPLGLATAGTSVFPGSVFRPGGGFLRANEPAGMTLINERAFNARNEGWDYDFHNEGTNSIITDATAPHSPSNVLQMPFAAGGSDGDGGNNADLFWTAKNVIYVYYVWKISSNWQGHPSGVNKVWFLKVTNPNAGAGNQLIFDAHGSGSGGLSFRMTGQRHAVDPSPIYNANLASGALSRNTWYEMEYIFTANTPGSRNGRLEAWLNGTKTHNYTNFGPLDSGEGPGFNGWKVNPIWGGTGGTINNTMYQYLDHMYVSGKN